jgi:hypothetical protein
MNKNDSKYFNIIRVTNGTSVDYRDYDIKPKKMNKKKSVGA